MFPYLPISRLILGFCLLVALPLALLAEEKKDDHDHEGETPRLNPPVILDPISIKNLGLETAEVEESTFAETVFALGHIEVLPGKKAILSSRIDGRAKTVIALPDMKCEEGDELVWVESRQAGDPPPVIRLDAPISGIISKVNIAQGQPISPTDKLVEIVDLETVEATAAVPEHLAGKLAKGQIARIKVPAFPDRVFEAELNHIGVEADAESGTVEAAFHVKNEEGLLRPGMRAEFSIQISQREGVVSVPVSAVQGDAVSRFVFVKDWELDHAFEKVPVVLGAANEERIEILEGLLPGDEVVVKGSYALAFAGKGTISLKEALDAAHGHPHNEDGSEMTKEQQAAAAAKAAGATHSHEAEGISGLTWMFAALSGVLLVLLMVATAKLNTRTNDAESC